PYSLGGHNLVISSSIGISFFPSEESDEGNFVQNADIAMYHAKVSGRNNYKYFTPELGQEHDRQSMIKNALKHAIENNELYLSYHPIYNLKTREINRVEVLLGWDNPKFGKISAE